MGWFVNNITFQQRDGHLSDATYLQHNHQYKYRLPPLPKLCLIANFNAAIFVAFLTVIFAISDQHKLVDSIVYFSSIIWCFALGAAAAVSSCFFDYKARVIYSKAASDIISLLGVAEIYDACVLSILITSLAIFTWGSYSTLYLIRNAFAWSGISYKSISPSCKSKVGPVLLQLLRLRFGKIGVVPRDHHGWKSA